MYASSATSRSTCIRRYQLTGALASLDCAIRNRNCRVGFYPRFTAISKIVFVMGTEDQGAVLDWVDSLVRNSRISSSY